MKSRKMLLPHPLLVFINDVHSTPRQDQPCPRHHAVQFGVGVPILFLVSAAVPIIPTIPENRTTPDARAKTTNENLDVICSWFVRHPCNHRNTTSSDVESTHQASSTWDATRKNANPHPRGAFRHNSRRWGSGKGQLQLSLSYWKA